MLGPRTLSSVVVVIIGVVPAVFGPWGVAVAFAALGTVALTELVAMFARLDYRILWPIPLITLLLALAAGAGGWPAWTMSALIAFALIAPAACLIVRPTLDGALPAWLATTFVSLYLAVPLGHVAAVRQIAGDVASSGHWLVRLENAVGFGGTTRGLAWFLLALVTTWLTDVFAYAAGRALGRHHMTPTISPKKTWEGFAGGVIGAMAMAVVANWAFGVGMRAIVAVLVGVVIALFATAGDLAESLLKRQTGVKDTGTLIPGHGGVLDRLDSQLFVFVAVFYIALAVG